VCGGAVAATQASVATITPTKERAFMPTSFPSPIAAFHGAEPIHHDYRFQRDFASIWQRHISSDRELWESGP
jgi:hypothetical protein